MGLKKRGKKGIFLSIDALYALTLAILLGGAVLVFSQAHEPQLIQLHQLGRDYLAVNYKNRVALSESDFITLTGLNSSANPQAKIASSVIAYPELCIDPPIPQCLQAQDLTGSSGSKTLVFNATVGT